MDDTVRCAVIIQGFVGLEYLDHAGVWRGLDSDHDLTTAIRALMPYHLDTPMKTTPVLRIRRSL